ncbi:hypothetical protein SLE2022_373620 [Rubroshorea leprosula]
MQPASTSWPPAAGGVQLFAQIADISLVGNLAFSNFPANPAAGRWRGSLYFITDEMQVGKMYIANLMLVGDGPGQRESCHRAEVVSFRL